MLASIDEISGAKRKQNLTEHADDARLSKQLATAKRDIPLELDLRELVAQEPDRSKLRDTFRLFELRDPLRRLEEALGSAEAAAPAPESTAAAAAAAAAVPQRAVTTAELAQLPQDVELALAVRAAGRTRGRAVRRRPAVALRCGRRRAWSERAHHGGVLGPATGPPRSSRRSARAR